METPETISADLSQVTLDTMSHLVYQAMEHLGWEGATSEEIASRVRRLDLGLPAEDHFIALVSWLGRCELVHKIDQKVYPIASEASIRIPDLLAVFQTTSGKHQVAIEVKTEAQNKLSWRPDFIAQLRQYGTLMGMPVLVACYWRKLNLWTLNDLDAFTLAKTNYNLKWDTALKESLLGMVAGDFNLVLKPGAGMHFVFRKERLISSDEEQGTEEWVMQITDVYYTDSRGERLAETKGNLLLLLMHFPLEERTRSDENYIYNSFVVSEENTMIMAQQSLSSLKRDETIRWSALLNSGKADPGADRVREGAEQGFSKGISQYILDLRPHTTPVWLKDVE